MERVVGLYIPFINQISYVLTTDELVIDTYVVIKINGAKFICKVGQKTQVRTIRHNMLKDASYIAVATVEEQLKYANTLEKTSKYDEVFNDAIREVKIGLDFIGVWPSINGRYVKFIYFASDKVDFRELIKVLINKLPKNTRIELMQIGTREYNAMLGGFGMCGYELCCHNRNYAAPVISTSLLKYIGYRIDLKDQMTGNCGKYKCCLLYEAEEYRDFMKNLPDYYEKINYKEEIYTVMDINIFNMIITLVSEKEKIEVHYDEFIEVYDGNNS